MSFCPKCGREILDESLGCPVCSVRENTAPNTEQQTTQESASVNLKKPAQTEQEKGNATAENGASTQQQFTGAQQTNEHQGTWNNTNTTQSHYQNNQTYQTGQQMEQVIPIALKVLIIVLILLVGGIGWIAGLVAGIILMKSPFEDYQKFGKVITILSAVLLGLVLVCCVLNGVLGLFTIPFLPQSITVIQNI